MTHSLHVKSCPPTGGVDITSMGRQERPPQRGTGVAGRDQSRLWDTQRRVPKEERGGPIFENQSISQKEK